MLREKAVCGNAMMQSCAVETTIQELWFIFRGQKRNVLPLPLAKCVTILKMLFLLLLQANILRPGVLVTSS